MYWIARSLPNKWNFLNIHDLKGPPGIFLTSDSDSLCPTAYSKLCDLVELQICLWKLNFKNSFLTLRSLVSGLTVDSEILFQISKVKHCFCNNFNACWSKLAPLNEKEKHSDRFPNIIPIMVETRKRKTWQSTASSQTNREIWQIPSLCHSSPTWAHMRTHTHTLSCSQPCCVTTL